MVNKYDAQLAPLWAQRIDGVDWNQVSSARTPDGGICFVGRLPGWFDTSTDIAALRLNADGSLRWLRSISVPMFLVFTLEHGQHGVEVSATGEVFIKLEQTAGDFILKLGTTGLPQWLAQVTVPGATLSSILPDAQRGCYFVLEGMTNWEALSLGRLNEDGATLWHRSYSWPNPYFHNLRLRNAPGGDVYVGGLQWGDLLCMRFSADGDPLRFKYFIPDVPFSTCPVAFFQGFESATDGRTALAAAYNTLPNSSLLLMDGDGHLQSGHELPALNVVGTIEKVYISDLDARGNELTMHSTLTRTQGSNYDSHALGLTAPFVAEDLCGFVPMAFEEVDVPVSELLVGDLAELNVNTALQVLEVPVTLSPLALWTSIPVCMATGIAQATAPADGFALEQTILPSGELLKWRHTQSGILKISDNMGRAVHEQEVGHSAPRSLSIFFLAPGVYLATFIAEGRLHTERFVVQ